MFWITAVIMDVSLVLSVTLLIIGKLRQNYIDNYDIIDNYILGLFVCGIVATIMLIILIKCSYY